MSRVTQSPAGPGRRSWIGLVAVEIVLFAVANVTAKNSSHPGTLSNVFFAASVIGAVLLIVLALLTRIRSRRRPAR